MPDYPQMPPLTQEEVISFLGRPLFAKFSTLNKDGSIHVAPLYFSYAEGDILLGTQEASRKVRNVKRNPNATILINDEGPILKAVIIYGVATLEYDDVLEKRTVIFEKYGWPHEEAVSFSQALANKWKPVIIRVKPHHIVSYDYSKGSVV